MKRSATTLFLFLTAVAAVTSAQDEPAQGSAGGQAEAPETRPCLRPILSRSIASSPRTPSRRKGLFTIHQVGERFYYEIPKSELGKQYLWNTQIAKTTLGVGYGGGADGQSRGRLGAAQQSRSIFATSISA